MKLKIVIFWLLIGLSFISIGYAANELWCTQSMSPFSSCTSKYIYLNQDNNQNNLPDYSLVPKANYIYNTNSSQAYDLIQLMTWTNIEYYMSTGNMLYTKDGSGNLWVMDNTLFKLQSWAFEYKKPVRALSAFRYVNIEVPSLTGITNPVVWFRYNYVLKKAIWYNWTTTSDYRYRSVPSLDYFWEQEVQKIYLTNNTKRSRSSQFTTSTCINYNVQWCGDKKVSTHTGYLLNNTFYPVAIWVSTGFTQEVCDSTTTGWVACTNWTAWCCNATCSWYGWANERCWDEKLQPAGSYYNWDENNMSFEECDDGDTEWDTDGVLNGDDPETHFCSSICLPTFTEAFVEVFINE